MARLKVPIVFLRNADYESAYSVDLDLVRGIGRVCKIHGWLDSYALLRSS